MDHEEIKKRVTDVVAMVLRIDKDKIAEESRFVEDLGAESIQAVELMAAFEEEFDIELDEDRSQDCKSIAMAIDYIKEAVNS